MIDDEDFISANMYVMNVIDPTPGGEECFISKQNIVQKL